MAAPDPYKDIAPDTSLDHLKALWNTMRRNEDCETMHLVHAGIAIVERLNELLEREPD